MSAGRATLARLAALAAAWLAGSALAAGIEYEE
jgi:hypothetical protein